MLAAALPASAIVATTADDICPPDADPCTITQEVDVESNALLDFGTRTVWIDGNGRLDVGHHSVTIFCGSFLATPDKGHSAVLARRSDAGEILAGSFSVSARRSCDAAYQPCLNDGDCDLGACGTRRCTKEPSRKCTGNGDCSYGVCQPNRRCSARSSVRCLSNADCDFGLCSEQPTCAGSSYGVRACTADEDCRLGVCSIGEGRIALGGAIDATSDDEGGLVRFEAAGDIVISKSVDVGGIPATDGDGGEFDAYSANGDVNVEAPIVATGFGAGYITLKAERDVSVLAELDVTGRCYGAGGVWIVAGRNVAIHDDVFASGFVDGSNGGDVEIEAKGDVTIDGTGPKNKVTVGVSADDYDHPNEEYCGDGYAGEITVDAEGAVHIGRYTKLVGNGGAPYGNGGTGSIEGSSVLLDGTIEFRPRGKDGSGGDFAAFADDTLRVGPAGSIDVSGNRGLDPGALTLRGERAVTIEGSLLNGGSWGTVASIDTQIDGCAVHLTGDSDVRHRQGSDVGLEILAGDSLRIAAGAVVDTDEGSIEILLRTTAKPPILEGRIEPPPSISLHATLRGCAPCGEAPPPEAPICDDSIRCTEETCSGDQCLSTPLDSACADDEVCNGVETCDAISGCLPGTAPDCTGWTDACNVGLCKETAGGCTAVAVVDGTACDDGDDCTVEDVCKTGQCAGTADPECNPCGNARLDPDEECDDGDRSFAPGDACTAECRRVLCGQPISVSANLPSSADALFILAVAVGRRTCDAAVCDVDESGLTDVVDALKVLHAAIGRPVSLHCKIGDRHQFPTEIGTCPRFLPWTGA